MKSSEKSSTEPLIRFSHVQKAFGAHQVFRDLNLDVFAGETLTLMGASGCGKSVALKLLIGLVECDAGSITFHGEDVTAMSDRQMATIRRRIGMLFQGAALFDSLSVGENVAYGLRELLPEEEMSNREVAERVAWALSLVGLPDIQEMTPGELSGGMKKRVGLARAIAVQPEVLLYDEPTTGLDPVNAERINHLIMGLKSAIHVTSIVVTHDLKSAFELSDRLAMIGGGEIIKVATAAEFQNATDPRVVNFVHGIAPATDDVRTLLAG
jgi:phospholipid/cholesterol/gamma-HCH transport system ATP-binding protein